MGSASEDEEEEEEEGDGGKWWMRNVSISRVLSIQSTKEMKEGRGEDVNDMENRLRNERVTYRYLRGHYH